jgi:hypothetical protein
VVIVSVDLQLQRKKILPHCGSVNEGVFFSSEQSAQVGGHLQWFRVPTMIGPVVSDY